MDARDYQDALDAASASTGDIGGFPGNARESEFNTARDRLLVEGVSTDGRVTIVTQGLRDWDVRIASGAVRGIKEKEFCRSVESAATDLVQRFRREIRTLRAQVWAA